MSPNYKKGGGRCGLLGRRNPPIDVLQRPGHGCEAGAPLSGWPSALPRRVGENKRNKRRRGKANRRGSRGALLRREPSVHRPAQHSTAGPGKVNPDKAV